MAWEQLPPMESGKDIIYLRQAEPTTGKGSAEVVDPLTGKTMGSYSPYQVRDIPSNKIIKWLPARAEIQESIAKKADVKSQKKLGYKSPSETWGEYEARAKAEGREPSYPSIYVAQMQGVKLTPEVLIGGKTYPILGSDILPSSDLYKGLQAQQYSLQPKEVTVIRQVFSSGEKGEWQLPKGVYDSYTIEEGITMPYSDYKAMYQFGLEESAKETFKLQNFYPTKSSQGLIILSKGREKSYIDPYSGETLAIVPSSARYKMGFEQNIGTGVMKPFFSLDNISGTAVWGKPNIALERVPIKLKEISELESRGTQGDIRALARVGSLLAGRAVGLIQTPLETAGHLPETVKSFFELKTYKELGKIFKESDFYEMGKVWGGAEAFSFMTKPIITKVKPSLAKGLAKIEISTAKTAPALSMVAGDLRSLIRFKGTGTRARSAEVEYEYFVKEGKAFRKGQLLLETEQFKFDRLNPPQVRQKPITVSYSPPYSGKVGSTLLPSKELKVDVLKSGKGRLNLPTKGSLDWSFEQFEGEALLKSRQVASAKEMSLGEVPKKIQKKPSLIKSPEKITYEPISVKGYLREIYKSVPYDDYKFVKETTPIEYAMKLAKEGKLKFEILSEKAFQKNYNELSDVGGFFDLEKGGYPKIVIVSTYKGGLLSEYSMPLYKGKMVSKSRIPIGVKYEVPYGLQPKTAHELFHYKTPKILFQIESMLKIPYKYRPSEILAYKYQALFEKPLYSLESFGKKIKTTRIEQQVSPYTRQQKAVTSDFHYSNTIPLGKMKGLPNYVFKVENIKGRFITEPKEPLVKAGKSKPFKIVEKKLGYEDFSWMKEKPKGIAEDLSKSTAGKPQEAITIQKPKTRIVSKAKPVLDVKVAPAKGLSLPFVEYAEQPTRQKGFTDINLMAGLETKQGLFSGQKPIVDVYQANENKLGFQPIFDVRLESGQEQVLVHKQKTFQEQKPIVDLNLDILSATIPISIKKQNIDVISKQEQIWDIPLITETKIREKPLMGLLFDLSKKKKEKGFDSYDAYAKDRGNFIKLNSSPLTREGAINLGAEVVDNTSSARFKIRKKKSRKEPDDYFGFADMSKFRQYSRRRGGFKIPLAEEWIENEGSRIDTYGELQGITVKGWKANRAKSSSSLFGDFGLNLNF